MVLSRGRVLIVESDAVFAALLEDRLRAAGYRVEIADNRGRALAAVSRGQPDLVILDLDMPLLSGARAVRAIREQAHGQTVPILALSQPLDGEGRVEILEAGASDLLARPVHLEELVLRAERLSRSSESDPVVLEGKVASYPLWEVLQGLEESRREGRLLVWNRWGGGCVHVGAGGRLVAAAWEGLTGFEALLATLGMKDGRFRFLAEPVPAESAGEPLEVRRALLEAAWIEDELERRREHSPGTGARLRLTGAEIPAAEPDLPRLLVEEVVERVRRRPGLRPFDLLAAGLAAPSRLRLTLAWLCDRGVLAADESAAREGTPPSTLEIVEGEILEAALTELLAAARERGVRISPVPILLLADPSDFAQPRRMFEELADRWRSGAVREFLTRLETRRGGTCLLTGEAGDVALHLQVLRPSTESRISAIVPACAGVVVWVNDLDDVALLEKILAGLEKASDPGVGFVVAAQPALADGIGPLLEGRESWRLVPEPPRNLLAVFRLIGGGRPERSGRDGDARPRPAAARGEAPPASKGSSTS